MNTPHHRSRLLPAVIAILGFALVGSGCSLSSSSGTDAATWATAYCTGLGTYQTAWNTERDHYKKAPAASTLAGAKSALVKHIANYLAITQKVLDQLASGGKPNIPDGQGYVDGYTKAFTTLKTSLTAAKTAANAISVSSSSFDSDAQAAIDKVNEAASQLVSDWNAVDKGFTDPGDNPLVHAMNDDTNCDTFRSS